MKKHDHLSDEDLLLYADLETDDRSSVAGNHLEGCVLCRARIAELKRALTVVEEAHVSVWHGKLPAADEARAALKARMAEIGVTRCRDEQKHPGWIPFTTITIRMIQWGSLVAACMLLAFLLRPSRPQSASALAALWEKPNQNLTPGATVPVTENQICGTTNTPDQAIPAPLEKKVLALYGITQPQPDQYEIDYLITPELGGATDIRNLWPEPYYNAVWNAHVKDQLENQLHRMVCRGEVDLATAQHDISTDWIAAYRKYFHVDTPVPNGSTLNSASTHSLPST
jgi:hypothetical protein